MEYLNKILAFPGAVPAIFIAGGLILGIIFEIIVLKKIEKIVSKTKWKVDNFIIRALKGVTFLLFITLGIHEALIHSHLSDEFVKIAHKTILVILIFAVTIVAARISVGFIKFYTKRLGKAFPSTSILTNLTYAVIILIGLLIILDTLGISITPLLTALGVGGLAAALALQDTLSNVFSGIHIIASGKIKQGHFIKLESGDEGYVTDITWRNTYVTTIQNNLIIVPNSKISTSIITNYTGPKSEMSLVIPVGVSYDSDLERVEEITLDVARKIIKEIPGGVPEYEPLIRYHTFGDFSIDFSVIIRVKEYVDQYLLKHEFVKALHARYHKEGIEIPFPIRTVYMRKGKDAGGS